MDRSGYPVRKTDLRTDEPPDWGRYSEAERFVAVWELSKQAWAFKEGRNDESRLPRHVASVIRRRR